MDVHGVRLEGVGKTFGGFAALADVSLDFEPGAVHALVGQNGAGKSTCLGVIAGRISATEGRVLVNGTAYPVAMRPSVARDLGVVAVYQELTIIPAMTAIDNVMLAAARSRFGFLDRARMRREYDRLSALLGVRIAPGTRAGELSVADQQMLEIMRALSVQCDVLLLDEPTAALAPSERNALFRTVKTLRNQGVTIFLVSHYLDEVLEQSDTVTVFRDGRVVERRDASAWTRDQLVARMLGSEFDTLHDSAGHPHSGGVRSGRGTAPVLRVAGLTSRDGVIDADVEVHAGEIVGLGGLMASGRTSLIRALSGAADVTAGTMWLDGVQIRVPRTPRQAARLGIRQLPEDRKRLGIVPELSAIDNMLLGQYRRYARVGFLDRGKMLRRVAELAAAYDLPRSMWERTAGRLSGGNQQKLLLARTGSQASRILLADEPTRGVDVGAKSVILDTLRRLADDGVAVIVASSDLEEVSALSDRVYVLREGRIVAELQRGTGTDEDRILSHAFGLSYEAAPMERDDAHV